MPLDQLGDALRQAREAAGLTQEVAAEAASLNRVALSYYESGQRQPPLNAVVALARIYGVTPTQVFEWADGTRPKVVDAATVLFRAAPQALEGRPAGGIHSYSAYVRAYVELLKDLGEQPRGKHQSPFVAIKPRAGRRDAARSARELRNYLGLGAGPLGALDLFRIVDEHVLVFRLLMGRDLNEAPSGLFYNHPEAGFCIVVNCDMSVGRQMFTLAHELAHAFFHSQYQDHWISWAGATLSYEHFANAFAGEFLVPGDSLAKAIEELGAWEELGDAGVVVHLQRHFGVSYASLLVRLRQEGFITEDQFAGLAAVSPTRLARALGLEINPADLGEYELGPLDRLPPRMLTLVRTAVSRGAITRGDAAETLGVSLEDVLRLMEMPMAEEAEQRNIRELQEAYRLAGDRPYGQSAPQKSKSFNRRS